MGSYADPFALVLFVVIAAGITCVKAGLNGNSEPNGPQIKESSPTYVPQRCLLDPESGHCFASIRRFFFNTAVGKCQVFTYGGCGGNWNRFETLEECHRTCTCKAAPETGPCRGHIRRWFYSPKDGVCRPFVFGGCGGNENNHKSWYECSNACGYPDPNNSWWKWWNEQGRWGEQGASGASNQSKQGYTESDFMKDYMMLGMIGEIELESMEDILNLYMQLQAMGGLSTMKSRQGSQSGSNLGSTGAAMSGAAGLGLSNLGELDLNGDGIYNNMVAGSAGPNFGSFGSNIRNLARNGQLGASSMTYMDMLLNEMLADADGSFTPLGYRGGSDGSFTPLGEFGSVSNLLGTGSSNLAKELGDFKSALDAVGFGALDFNVGSGATGSFAQHGWAPSGGFDIIKFIKALAAGRITPRDMRFMARMLGAMDSTGKIDINIMLSQLSRTLSNLKMATSGQLKGIAQGFGAIDINGNINLNRFLQGIASSMGGIVSQMSRAFGPMKKWPVDTSTPGKDFITFIEHLASGQLSSADMTNMARMLGVLDLRGQINVNAMAQRLMNALSNPGIARDLKGTAMRLGAIDNNGNIDIKVFISKLGGPMGSFHGMKISGSEILNFITQLATGRSSPKTLKAMASKAGIIDRSGNINLGILVRGILGSLSSPSTAANIKVQASRMGAMNKDGSININRLLRRMLGALKGTLGGLGGPLAGVGGAMDGMGGATGGASDRTQPAVIVPHGRSLRKRSTHKGD